jgi:chemotaxis protein MotA
MSTHTNSAPPDKTEFVRATYVRSIVDIAIIFEIPSAFALIITAIVHGVSPYALIDTPSIYIIPGGIFGITVACYFFRDVGTAFIIVISNAFNHTHNLTSAAFHVSQLADLSRGQALLAMEPYISHLMAKEMLHKGLEMLLDGSSGDEIERILQREMQAAARRYFLTLGVLRKAAEISPAMGLIGTLSGLVQMIGNLIQARLAPTWLSPCSQPIMVRL